MQKIKVIGHRGVRTVLPENTLKSIKFGIKAGADAIEFDTRLTADGQLAVIHNASLGFTCGINKYVKRLTWAELSRIPTLSGEPIPRLQDILDNTGDAPLVIEIKSPGSVDALVRIISHSKYNNRQLMVTSFLHHELALLKKKMPDIPIFVASSSEPLKVVITARKLRAYSLTLNLWILNPITYWQARRSDIRIMVYTNRFNFLLSWPLFCKFLSVLYPGVMLCSDRPDRIAPIFKR